MKTEIFINAQSMKIKRGNEENLIFLYRVKLSDETIHFVLAENEIRAIQQSAHCGNFAIQEKLEKDAIAIKVSLKISGMGQRRF